MVSQRFAIFWYVLICCMYIMWPKQFKYWKAPSVDGSIVVVCALLCTMYDLKAAQMNMQHCLIQKFMLYKFDLDHNVTEATKNICCAKGESTVDPSTVTR